MRSLLLIILFAFPAYCLSQARNLPAVKISQPMKIDGELYEPAWQLISPTSDFITSSPTFGLVSKYKSEVRIAYDNSAVYVGAYLYDQPGDIRRQLTARDVISMQDVDYFVVGFDTYHDRQNAFVFRVTAAGVQGDARESQNGSGSGGVVFDAGWDAVWESKTSIKHDGWVVEMRIPFSAIRFAKKDIQDWGINFARFVRKINENSIWNPVDPNISGDINQWGNWTGLKNIVPPLRLSFLPYLSGGVKVSPTQNGRVTEFLRSGGMDLKYGINESFTLDMTLIPDFAQVQSDNVFLNLSPFQVKFDDYRPFFTEGTELFNKAGLFYSRRVGASPGGSAGVLSTYGNQAGYEIIKNPGITRLYNATKFSGRTKKNLGIGIFNALSAPMNARIKNLSTGKDSTILTEPLTNYNIIVLDQALKNRSSISFTNTNVLRKGNSRNANVSSLDISLFNRRNRYNFTFTGKYSSIWGKLDNYNGFTSAASFGKVSGILQYKAAVSVESDRYDPNDLGYLQNNNSLEYAANVSYNKNKPTRHFLIHSFRANFRNTYLYKPFVWSSFNMGGSAFFLFRNFWDATINFSSNPVWYKDYFLNSSAYNGYYLRRAPYYYMDISGSSDSRKKFFFNWLLGGGESPLPRDPYWQGTLGFRYRFSDHFQVSTNMNLERDKGNWGWAFFNNANGSPVIARRNVSRNTNVLNAQYNFNARMNVSVRVRHYWSLLENTNFYDLKPDGNWTEVPFIPGKNVNFNTFNLDLFYTWDFLLGSRLTIAWKNALGGNVSIDPYTHFNYAKNFRSVVENPHSNELTLKIVYFLDYLKLRKNKKNGD
ncbi:MAG: carbohydrate binding family 9 domain-containing protein [Chitinophagaceae bacterium]|nr:carbohydrate binding family 9 domain-containing protein [Chitinophagaceae bacterium]